MGKTPAQEVLDEQNAQNKDLEKIGIVTEKLDEVQTPTTEDDEDGFKDLSEEDEYKTNLKDDEDEESKEPKKGSNPIKEKFLNRGEKRRQEIEELRATVDTKFGEIADMISDLKKSGSTKQETVDTVNAELEEFAKANNYNDDQKKELYGLAGVLQKQLEAKYKPLEEKLSSTEERDFWAKDAQIFENNWKATEKELNALYPNATAEQKTEAKELMDELAHSEDYGYVEGKHDPYSQSYILYEKADEFDAILNSPKKKSFEPSKNSINDNEPDEIDWDSDPGSLKEAARRQEILDKKIGTSETFIVREGRRLK